MVVSPLVSCTPMRPISSSTRAVASSTSSGISYDPSMICWAMAESPRYPICSTNVVFSMGASAAR